MLKIIYFDNYSLFIIYYIPERNLSNMSVIMGGEIWKNKFSIGVPLID